MLDWFINLPSFIRVVLIIAAAYLAVWLAVALLERIWRLLKR